MTVFWQGKAVGVNKRLLYGKSRMVPNKDYQAFKESIAWKFRKLKGSFLGLVDVNLTVCLRKGMDTDSVIKPCLDALQLGGVVVNDGQVRNIHVIREYHKKGELDRIWFFVDEVKEA